MNSSTNPNAILKLFGITTGSTLGAAFFGFTFATLLYGVTCCQTINYYRSRRSRADSHCLKALVALLWILDTSHQGIITHMVYYYLIINYDNLLSLSTVVWSLPTEMMLNAVIGVVVQSFLVYRLWSFNRNTGMAAFCELLAIASFTLGVVSPIQIYMDPHLEAAEGTLKSYSVATLSTALTSDAVIALTTAYYLHRSRTGFRETNGILTRLMVFTVATGGLTTLTLLANLVAFVAAPKALYFMAFNPAIGKLCTNSVLTMLNDRGLIYSEASLPTPEYIKHGSMFSSNRLDHGSSLPSVDNGVTSHTIDADSSTETASLEA